MNDVVNVLYFAQLVVTAAQGEVIHDGNKVIPDVPFLFVGLRVVLMVGHLICNEENYLNCNTQKS